MKKLFSLLSILVLLGSPVAFGSGYDAGTTTGVTVDATDQSVSVGIDATAGTGSVAVGDNADASHTNSVAIGLDTIGGTNAVTLGKGASAHFQQSVAIGATALADTSDGGTAIGYGTHTAGISAIALGYAAAATANYAVAIGAGVTSAVANHIVLGEGADHFADFSAVGLDMGAKTITTTGVISGLSFSGSGAALTGVVTSEIDPTVNTSAEIQAIIGAGVYQASGTYDAVTTAGRSLTRNTNDFVADAELYTDVKTIYIMAPLATDDLKTIWVAPLAATITKISCESDQTVDFDLQVDDGSPAAVNGSDIACTAFATDSTLAGDTSMAAGDRLDLAITSVSGTPTWVSISWEYTYDD